MDRRAKPAVRSDAERNQIAEDNRALAWRYIASRWPHSAELRRLGWDEAIGACQEGILRAAALWRPEVARFSTYAFRWMRQRLNDALRNNYLIHVPKHVYGADTRQRKSGAELLRCAAQARRLLFDSDLRGDLDLDDLADGRPAEQLDPLDPHAQAVQLLDAADLDARARQILRLRYLKGKTLAQIGYLLRITRERVRQIEARALASLRRQVEAGRLGEA